MSTDPRPTTETRSQRLARHRRRAATRAREYRQRHRDAGRPFPRDVDAAWAEASAFILARETRRLRAAGTPAALVQIPMVETMRIARRILVERGGFNPIETAKAVTSRLKPREEHSWPHFVPRHGDDEGAPSQG